MKNKRIFILAGLLLAAGAASALLAQEHGDRVGYKDTIVVGPEETRDTVVSFGGDIIVEGKVRRTVFALGGSITVSGEVGEAVVGLGSRIILKSTAVVRGDLVGLGGTITKEPGCRVEHDTVFFKSSALSGKIFKEGLKGLFSLSFWPLILIFKLVNIFIWLLLAAVGAALFPRQIVFAAAETRKHVGATLGTGLLVIVLFTFFVVFSAVLCLVLIGIPILMSLAVAGLIVKVFGKIVVFYIAGESLARSLGIKHYSPVGGTVLGLFLLSFVGFVPVLGWLVSMVLSVLGWGIAIRTRFGTAENWFRRGPRLAPPMPPPPPAV